MKYIYIITWLIILLICGNSCKCGSLILSYDSRETKISENIYWHINDFYNVYLRFPLTVSELSDFIWHIVNEDNDFKYKSFESYWALENNIITSNMETIRFLVDHENEIKTNCKRNKFTFTYKGKTLEIRKDICKDLKLPLGKSNITHMLNTCETFFFNGKMTRKHYSDDFQELLKSVKRQYLYKYSPNNDIKESIYSAFRYDQSGLKIICSPLSIKVGNNFYLKELSFSLDTFISKRNIDVIQFIIRVPDENK